MVVWSKTGNPGQSTMMQTKEAAVTFYVFGLLTGMIVAFASCSADRSAGYEQQPTQTSSAQVR